MKNITLKTLSILAFSCFLINSASAAVVVATIGGRPITDTDITARTKLMTMQGDTSTNNRHKALKSIIDDYIKLDYAANFKAIPSDSDVNKEIKSMNLGDMSSSEKAMAKSAVKANIAWQVVVARTIVPTIDISDDDIKQEQQSLERDRGLPIDLTIVRLVNIPADVAGKLTRPRDCDDAVRMAEELGGAPQKFTAAQYELSADIRERVVGLPHMTWSSHKDDSVLLVCDSKKAKEYGELDGVIKQNTVYKKAMFLADQQLKQLRRKAVIVINDDKYKI